MKISEIQELIKFVSKSGISEVEIEDKDFKINIKTPPFRRGKGNGNGNHEQGQIVTQMIPGQMPMQQQPIQTIIPQSAPSESAVNSDNIGKEEENLGANYIEVKSPMIGTFYRKSAPDKPDFVKVGDTIEEGDVVCVIEAMKLFNEIESEVSGKIVKVMADDSSPVQYDQVLFLVDPSA